MALKRKYHCNIVSELDSKKRYLNKFPDEKADIDYKWFLDHLSENVIKTKAKRCKNVDEEINDSEDENVSEDANDEDPQYLMFLENLEQHGKSYKLKVSKDDEPLRFLYYEQSENSDEFEDDDNDPSNYEENANQSPQDMQIVQRDEQMLQGKEGEILAVNEVSKKGKIDEQKDTFDSCYQKFFETCNPSRYGAFSYKGNEVNYEKKEKQIVLSEKHDGHQSLKEKLMGILRKPFSRREYKNLKEYVEKQNPVGRLLPLRRRSISSALKGKTKSVLDDSPGCFRRRFELAKQERSKSKALNLLRMLCFWLEHVPNDDVFEPWFDKEILEVLPLRRSTS